MVCFIILHYVVMYETELCVSNIQNLEGNKRIIIVDNASPNGSGKELEKEYADIDNVEVILLTKNLGFAKGNNVGYTYARKQYNPGYIVVLNNDIQIKQNDFISRIADLYKTENYAVLGPDVYATTLGVHQNPKRLEHYTLDEVQDLLKKYEKKIESKRILRVKSYLKRIKFLKRFVYNNRIRNNAVNYKQVYYNVPLHGSCLVFSKKFINLKEEAFFDGTFMYYESEILDYECHSQGLKTMYTPEVQVLHNHNVSTNKTFTSDVKRTEFMNECIKNSLTAFLSLIEKN